MEDFWTMYTARKRWGVWGVWGRVCEEVEEQKGYGGEGVCEKLEGADKEKVKSRTINLLKVVLTEPFLSRAIFRGFIRASANRVL